MENQTFEISPEVVATLLARLCVDADSPVAKAATRHEAKVKRLFLRSVKQVQNAIPMEELEAVLSLGHPGTGAPVYVLEEAISKFSSALVNDSHRNAMRAAEEGPLSSALGAAMASGAKATELCVTEPVLSAKKVTATKSTILKVWEANKAGLAAEEIATQVALTEEQVKWIILKIKVQVPQMVKVLGAENPLLGTVAKSVKVTPTPTAAGTWPLANDVARSMGTNYPSAVEHAYRSWARGLSASERSAIESYTGSYYQSINGMLRGRTTPHPSIEKSIEGISNALAKAPKPPPPELVWRGVKGEHTREWASKLATGDIVEMKGFQSTTINPKFASDWGDSGYGGTLFEIKPSSGGYVLRLSEHESEYEFLLPHGSKYKVVGRTTVKINTYVGGDPHAIERTVIQLEQLP